MKKLLLTSITFLLITGISFAQDLKKAYILTLKGDTVHGYVDATDWGMNPSKILFKTYPGDPGTLYGPYDIKEFGMNGEVWEGGFVDVEVSSRESNNISNTADLILEKDLVFLQAIIKGKKSLYLYSKGIYELYYIKRDTIFDLLVYKKYMKDESKPDDYLTRNVVKENKKYQGQLIVYFDDCPQIKDKISKTRYEKEDLERLFFQYYDCIQSDFRSLKPVKNAALKWGVTAGYGFSTIDFIFIKKLAIQRALEPVNCNIISFGASLELSRPVSLPNWSIYNDVTLVIGYSYRYDTSGVTNVNTNFQEFFDHTAHSWKLVNMLRYKLYRGDIILFANAGLTSDFLFGKIYWQQKKESILIGEQTYSNTYKKTLYVAGLGIGAGVSYHRFSMELRGEPVHSSKFFGPTFNVLVNYRF